MAALAVEMRNYSFLNYFCGYVFDVSIYLPTYLLIYLFFITPKN